MSQSRTVPSRLPEASRVPSGENATVYTFPVCPRRVVSSCPVAASQSLIVWSCEPVARMAPSGEKATAATQPSCPSRVARSRSEATFQSLAVRGVGHRDDPVTVADEAGPRLGLETREVPQPDLAGLAVRSRHPPGGHSQ